MTKRCAVCKEVKTLTDFYKQKGGPQGRHSWCKTCSTVYYAGRVRTWPKDKRRANNFKVRYGLSVEQVATMQADGCHICGSHKKLCIDHDHKTGKVRGALCHQAGVLSWSGQIVRHGKAEAQPSSRDSLLRENGNLRVLVSGREIDAAAKDAERNTNFLRDSLKYTISELGLSSLNSDLSLQILCCSVVSAISLFIPGEIKSAPSYDLKLRSISPYTLIPHRGKPAADGPRYKALGNSWAVPVVRWIGNRILRVSE